MMYEVVKGPVCESTEPMQKLEQDIASIKQQLEAAAVDRKQLHDLVVQENKALRKHVDDVAATLTQQLSSILLAIQSQPHGFSGGVATTLTPEGGASIPPLAPSNSAPSTAQMDDAASSSAAALATAAEEKGKQDEELSRKQEEEAAAAAQRAAAEAAAEAAAAAAMAPKIDPAEAARRRAEEEDVERNWKDQDVLSAISMHAAGLEELPESILDLHDGMPSVLRQAPMRLLRVESVLRWENLHVYEEVGVPEEAVELPYDAVDNATWNSTIILSWRWTGQKPAEQQPGFSPMSDMQYAELSSVLQRALREGITFVWIDWCCVPQYCRSPMVEVLRSKVFYARARAMTVIPTFHPIPTEGIVRLLLVKAGRVIKKRASSSVRSAIVAARLESILSREQVAGREYFSRVWTLAERMARFGRPDRLCNWLSLEAWMGMLVDAMLKSTDDRSASAIYKRILGSEAGQLLDAILGPLGVAVRTGSMHVSEGLEDKVAELFEMAVGIWHTPKELAEAPTREWLMSYLLEAHSGFYQAWSDADRIWSVYSYFCWKQLDQGTEAGQLEALQDLVRVAGGSRKHLMCMATKLGLAKIVPPADVDGQLAAAAAENDTAGMVAALEVGASPDYLGKDGATALWFAAKGGNMEVVRLLLRAGASLNITATDGSTALNCAAEGGHLEVVRALVGAGAKLEVSKQTGGTPLHSAAQKGHLEVVRLLLEAGADKEALDSIKVTPLYAASAAGHVDVVRLLIDYGANKEATGPESRTPLIAASVNGKVDVVRLLLHAGANKEASYTEFKFTAMHGAALMGHVDVLKALLEAGCNKEAMTKYGTPIHRAALKNQAAAIKFLAANKVALNAKNLDQKATAMMVAAINGMDAAVKELIAAGADLEAEDKDYWRAIHYAAKGNSYNCVKLLITAGAAQRPKTKAGNIPKDLTSSSKVKDLLPGRPLFG